MSVKVHKAHLEEAKGQFKGTQGFPNGHIHDADCNTPAKEREIDTREVRHSNSYKEEGGLVLKSLSICI